MNKKNIFLPIIVLGVSIVFIIISLLVILTKGKPSLLKKKLQLGALLITLTVTIPYFGSVACCYAPPNNSNDVILDEENTEYNNTVFLNFNFGNTITGVTYSEEDELYYTISDSDNNMIVSGTVELPDSSSNEKEFVIRLNKTLEKGEYILSFPRSEDGNDHYIKLIITDKEHFFFDNDNVLSNELNTSLDLYDSIRDINISVNVLFKDSDNYSFRITDNDSNEIYSADFESDVLLIDTNHHEMKMKIPNKIANGTYNLYIYNKLQSEQSINYDNYLQSFNYSIDNLNEIHMNDAYIDDPSLISLIELDLSQGNIITGYVSSNTLTNYYVRIDYESKGKLIPIDGSFDSEFEEFKFEIDPNNIKSGEYILNISRSENTLQDVSYRLNINNPVK